MSLNWNLEKVTSRKLTGKRASSCDNASHDGGCMKCGTHAETLVHDSDGKPIPWVVTDALIWLTMACGIGYIVDEKTGKEFATRVKVYQKMNGPWLLCKSDPEKGRITTKQVMAHVGMTTNVSTETRTQWMSRMGKSFFRDADCGVRMDLKPVEAETVA